MKTDIELRRDVLAELESEPSIDARSIAVTVKDGIVTLSGTVSNYYEKWEAEKVVRRVTGVKAVANDIQVKLPILGKRTDADIAKDAVNALSMNLIVPYDRIQVTVEGGWLTLEGSVDWNFQREAAEDAVRKIKGVKGITNLIEVKPFITPTEVKTKIKEELKRTVTQDAERIQVSISDGTVELEGAVHSWFEREEAERVAWSVPGVKKVEDHIIVEP